jgi:cytochrome c oxidase cbb3-type subunit 3
MNVSRAFFASAAVGAILVASGCTSFPGKPAADSIPVQPENVVNFDALYAQNCAGCHGIGGKGGIAIGLADPAYLGIVDDAVIRKVTANGVAGTAMPAFAQSAGGLLTDAQVDAIVTGIRTRWGKQGGAGALQNPPPYSASAAGNAAHGAEVFATYCSTCHGAGGKGNATASSIVDPAYLSLVSDQDLRTTVIAGRADIGSPNLCGDVAGKCMTAQEVTDVVAWLASQRVETPGQPYPNAAPGGPEKSGATK